MRRRKRKTDIAAARLERERSDRLKAEAQAIARDLREIRRKNHFAEALRALIEENGQ